MKRALCTVLTALILLLTSAVPALAENAILEPVTLEEANEAILLPEDGSADFEVDPDGILLPGDDDGIPLDLVDDILSDVPIDLDIPDDAL